MKSLFFDVETTGLDPQANAIHQLSVIIDIDGEVVEEVDYKLSTPPGKIIVDEALAVSKVSRDDLLGYPNFSTVYTEFIELMSKYVDRFNKKDKFFLVGYNNASFDNNFLRAFFNNCRDKYYGSWFWANPIDVYVMASFIKMAERANYPNFKLMTAAGAFGIEIDEEKLHDALYDAQVTRKLFYEVLKHMK